MIQSLLKGLARRILPGPGIAGLYLLLLAPLAAGAIGDPRPWAIVLLGLGLAAGIVSALFSQWRILGGLMLASLAAFLHSGYLVSVPTDVAALATGLLGVGIATLAAVPERGLTGPGPALALGTALLVVATVLRGPVDQLPAPDLVLGAFTLGSLELTVTLTGLLAAIALLLSLGTQLLKPSSTAGTLFAILLCTLPLGLGRSDLPDVLAFSGGAALLAWTGLLSHAWHLAFVDELTGLPNRRALELRLRRRGESIAMADVDHFKRFNDRWGHDAGDQVLRRVAESLAAIRGGRAYRYGGEEFAIVFRSRQVDRMRAALENCRRRIAERPFRLRTLRTDPKERGRGGGRDVRISASFGLAIPMRGDSAHQTLKRADGALYRAKRNGRNRLEIRE